VVTDDSKYAKVDAQVMVKFRVLLPILQRSREARDAVKLALDLIEGLPGGVAVLRDELHKRRGL
jgi:hypothetical protein